MGPVGKRSDCFDGVGLNGVRVVLRKVGDLGRLRVDWVVDCVIKNSNVVGWVGDTRC